MRKFLIIIFCFLGLVGIGWYIYTKSHQTQKGVPAISDFSTFFPVGNSNDPTVNTVVSPTPKIETSTVIPSAFKQLSPHAVAGYTTLTQEITTSLPPDPLVPKAKPVYKKTTKSIIRYVSRNNGYVYEIANDALPLQISNVYIPNIYETLFGDKGTTSILRFLRPDQRTIATYNVPIPPPNPDGTRTQREGTYLTDNISTLALSPDTMQIARLISDANGATLSISNTTGTKKSDIIRTPFREWLVSWPQTKNLYLQTKASSTVPGYLYRVDTIEKKLRRVLGGMNGFTASVSPNGAYILYSQSTQNGIMTSILNTKTNTTRTMNLMILPEKCAWYTNEDLVCAGNTTIPEKEYPDAWYQGTMTFSDKLYHIYTNSLVFDTIYDNSAKSFDMTNLTIDEKNQKVYFIDKTTGLLWQMKY